LSSCQKNNHTHTLAQKNNQLLDLNTVQGTQSYCDHNDIDVAVTEQNLDAVAKVITALHAKDSLIAQ
jgi:hypothetical protein